MEVPGSLLFVRADGYEAREILWTTAPMDVVLEPQAAPESGLLSGRWIDSRGLAVAGGLVALGGKMTTTNEAGEFQIECQDLTPEDRLIAVTKGHLPVIESPESYAEDGTPKWPESVELVLGGPALTIRGHLTRADGSAVTRGWVWAANPLAVGTEACPVHVENIIDDLMHTYWYRASTADDGSFELGALMDRDYVLRAMDRDDRRMVMVESEPIGAGATDVVLTLPTDRPYPALRGRVETRYGEPLEGVDVTVVLNAWKAVDPRGERSVISSLPGHSVRTDDRGRFEFPGGAGRFHVALAVTHPSSFGIEIGLSAEPSSEPLRIVLPQAAAVEIVVADTDRADSITFHRMDGEVVEVRRTQTTEERPLATVPLESGQSGTLWANDLVDYVSLWKEGEVIDEIEVELSPGAEPHRMFL